ncbi:hypothetical protein [Fischerella thermalis]|uniref:Uncharacterized protein n=1 Tax=Fischerella thermalis CCMEE 5318 TaxID=2019666 RepID=A0A2N6LHV8_9CYAN|nr:hypothetical protein [Fischerella thermalis]PMB18653.1 hypothetical protein CEN47_24110 [Fischerella thermalis CCMEE 5319]PMB23791.1 hypothetical protein CEN46_09515 [Fischerella thermalis CCMEE 5318]
MLSRESLRNLSLPQLQQLGRKYGIQPLGNWGQTEAWVNMLAAFPYKAIDQMRDGVGIHSPGIEAYHAINVALDLLGQPTNTQKALIRATKNNEWLEDEHSRRYQQKLLDLWSVKLMLEQCQQLLAR